MTIGRNSRYLSKEALRMAVKVAKGGKNVDRYKEAVACLEYVSSQDPSGFAELDVEWIEAREKQVKQETDKLEHELKGYKNNLIKESIRMGNEDLGAFYYEIGDLANANKAYTRMREYCTTPKHVSEMELKLLLVAAAQDNWMAVQAHAYKIQNLVQAPAEKILLDAPLQAALGLANMCTSQYKTAATHFLAVDPSLVAEFASTDSSISKFTHQLLTPNDIAVYGGLTALASLSAADLRVRALDQGTSFRTYLELEPAVRRAVACFVAAKYPGVLAALAAYRTDYLLDIHLRRHVHALHAAIRKKCLIEHCRPFSHVRVDALATAFATPVEDMRTELLELIGAGSLEARLDLVDDTLVASVRDRRAGAYAKALAMAADHERSLKLRLFNISMQNAGLVVQGKPNAQNSQGSQSGKQMAGGNGGQGRRRD